jgi:UDP-3-O-[3-hydroxymyristoyl] glucosamine N-acyltransferase
MMSGHRGTVTLSELAKLVEGCVSGDPSTAVSGVAPLDQAEPGEISFLANPKYRDKLATCQAAAIIVHPSLDGCVDRPLLLVDNPYLAFAKILSHFSGAPQTGLGVLEGAHVDPQATIAQGVSVHPGCVVSAGASIGRNAVLLPGVVVGENAVIGEDCLLHANAVVRERCVLGARVILQPGAVVGADGFGFAADGEQYYKIPQVGHVVLEDDVEVGACSCIDRGTLSETRIGRGSKIDNLVQVAHNVSVGGDTILVAQSGIAGSTTIGRHCIFGGQSACAGHLTIGDNVTVAARGGLSHNVESNQQLAGVPALPHREWLKATMCVPHLPEMRRELRRLRQQVEELKQILDEKED